MPARALVPNSTFFMRPSMTLPSLAVGPIYGGDVTGQASTITALQAFHPLMQICNDGVAGRFTSPLLRSQRTRRLDLARHPRPTCPKPRGSIDCLLHAD